MSVRRPARERLKWVGELIRPVRARGALTAPDRNTLVVAAKRLLVDDVDVTAVIRELQERVGDLEAKVHR